MGRHLKPISDRKPAKKLALKLRELKGDIPFARLAKAVHVKPNTLSTMADGTFRGWRCVEQFLDAVEKCGGTVTAQDRSECRAYHKIADQLHRERTGVGSPHSVHISAPALQIDTVVLAPRVAEEGVDEVVTFTHTESTVACPSSLARCRNQHDIVIALIDLVLDQKMDLQSWRHRTTFPGASRRTRAPGMAGPHRPATAHPADRAVHRAGVRWRTEGPQPLGAAVEPDHVPRQPVCGYRPSAGAIRDIGGDGRDGRQRAGQR